MSGAQERVLGPYRLLERIGKGGMGEVYRARHTRLGSERAVKVLPGNLVSEADFLKRFEREAASAAGLTHPHILQVYDYGEDDGTPYLVMPYVTGGTLKDRLAQGNTSRAQVINYLSEVAGALDYAHQRGIVHRDVKPANILIDEHDHAYLADFGIAKAVEGAEQLTRTGVGIGTPEYMAPEQAQGRADPRSDLYALGIMVYQVLTGQVPFTGNSTVEVLMKHLQEPVPLAPLHGPAATVLGPVVQRALAKDPDARYQSGRALMDAVGAGLARLGPEPAERAPATVVAPGPAGGNQGAQPQGGSPPLYRVGPVSSAATGMTPETRRLLVIMAIVLAAFILFCCFCWGLSVISSASS